VSTTPACERLERELMLSTAIYVASRPEDSHIKLEPLLRPRPAGTGDLHQSDFQRGEEEFRRIAVCGPIRSGKSGSVEIRE